ncbi:hypothetical protein [Nodularia sphaerocarpa]|nr:hypothetical protein [Nodularia sphaerocarpa]
MRSPGKILAHGMISITEYWRSHCLISLMNISVITQVREHSIELRRI